MITFDKFTKENRFFRGKEFVSYNDYLSIIKNEISCLKRQGFQDKNYCYKYIKENYKNVNENDILELIC